MPSKPQSVIPFPSDAHACDMPLACTQELAALEAQVAKERASRQAVLSEQRAATQTLGLANKALLTRQFGEGQAAASIAGAAGAGGAEGAAEVPEVSSEEEAVTQLCKAVAAASVGAMLDRVLPQQETHENLVSMQAAAKRQVGGGLGG